MQFVLTEKTTSDDGPLAAASKSKQELAQRETHEAGGWWPITTRLERAGDFNPWPLLAHSTSAASESPGFLL